MMKIIGADDLGDLIGAVGSALIDGDPGAGKMIGFGGSNTPTGSTGMDNFQFDLTQVGKLNDGRDTSPTSSRRRASFCSASTT